MLINYLKIAIRSMLRNKILACINIAGNTIDRAVTPMGQGPVPLVVTKE